MKTEIGMYCYNKTNRKLGIGKIISFQSNNNVNVRYKNDIELVNIGNIIASHNIIDLIEVGDYVNGKEVTCVTGNNYIELDYGCNMVGCNNEDIKTILTKEQFENNCYEIGDE